MSKADDIRKQINTVMKKEVLHKGSDPRFSLSYIPTGVVPIDILIGGGIPRGRITELYGDWSTMKSYLCLKAAAQVQSEGGVVVYVDTEHSYDPEWAAALGCNPDDIVLMHPATGEEAIDAMETAIRMEAALCVWDSVAATLPQDEWEAAAEDKVQPGRLAFLMSRGLRKLNTANKHTAMIFTNQIREKIGVRYGSPETTPGGRALPFYASMRVNLRKAGKVREKVSKDGEGTGATLGMKIRASVEKSKINSPQRDITFTFSYEDPPGVDMTAFITDFGVAQGFVIVTNKTKYSCPSYDPKKVVTYRTRWEDWVNSDDDLYEHLLECALEYTGQ